MTTAIQTDKKQIVREIIDIIHECEADGMETMINMQACLFLKEKYGYDRAECTMLIIGAELIDELDLMD
tara:strand:- start:3300 stop:3506 length:207 start_codon:yes stop_codon:yes gene_type:complete